MATIPTLVHSQTAFLWRFIIFGASDHQIIHVAAWTEAGSASALPGWLVLYIRHPYSPGGVPCLICRNYRYLINSHFNCEHDIAKKVYSAADGATDNISMAVASIGSLMWHASENEEYDEKAMRIDMGNIGLLLAMLGHLIFLYGAPLKMPQMH